MCEKIPAGGDLFQRFGGASGDVTPPPGKLLTASLGSLEQVPNARRGVRTDFLRRNSVLTFVRWRTARWNRFPTPDRGDRTKLCRRSFVLSFVPTLAGWRPGVEKNSQAGNSSQRFGVYTGPTSTRPETLSVRSSPSGTARWISRSDRRARDARCCCIPGSPRIPSGRR